MEMCSQVVCVKTTSKVCENSYSCHMFVSYQFREAEVVLTSKVLNKMEI